MGLLDKVLEGNFLAISINQHNNLTSGFGFGGKADLGAGGLHLLCLPRRLLCHQPAALH